MWVLVFFGGVLGSVCSVEVLQVVVVVLVVSRLRSLLAGAVAVGPCRGYVVVIRDGRFADVLESRCHAP
eukprot:450101-Pyramimonas_sp.AAC.1